MNEIKDIAMSGSWLEDALPWWVKELLGYGPGEEVNYRTLGEKVAEKAKEVKKIATTGSWIEDATPWWVKELLGYGPGETANYATLAQKVGEKTSEVKAIAMTGSWIQNATPQWIKELLGYGPGEEVNYTTLASKVLNRIEEVKVAAMTGAWINNITPYWIKELMGYGPGETANYQTLASKILDKTAEVSVMAITGSWINNVTPNWIKELMGYGPGETANYSTLAAKVLQKADEVRVAAMTGSWISNVMPTWLKGLLGYGPGLPITYSTIAERFRTRIDEIVSIAKSGEWLEDLTPDWIKRILGSSGSTTTTSTGFSGFGGPPTPAANTPPPGGGITNVPNPDSGGITNVPNPDSDPVENMPGGMGGGTPNPTAAEDYLRGNITREEYQARQNQGPTYDADTGTLTGSEPDPLAGIHANAPLTRWADLLSGDPDQVRFTSEMMNMLTGGDRATMERFQQLPPEFYQSNITGVDERWQPILDDYEKKLEAGHEEFDAYDDELTERYGDSDQRHRDRTQNQYVYKRRAAWASMVRRWQERITSTEMDRGRERKNVGDRTDRYTLDRRKFILRLMGFDTSGHDDDLGGAAEGGTVNDPGLLWTGERGRELLNLPKHATITPLDRLNPATAGVSGQPQVINIDVHIGNKKIERLVFESINGVIRQAAPRLFEG